MLKTDDRITREKGQVLVLAVMVLTLCTTLMLGLFQVSMTVREKIRLQISADTSVLSALNTQAHALNSIALVNRAILANDAFSGQLNALYCETRFYRILSERFRRILQFIPYAGTAARFVSAGIGSLEKTVRRAASISLPLAHSSNILLQKIQVSIRHLLPLLSLRSAKSTLQTNKPGAQLIPVSEAHIFKQAQSLRNHMIGLDEQNLKKLKTNTMDNHTLKRNWNIRVAGISPIKKLGGTRITSQDLFSKDVLRLKVFKNLQWKWKTAISVGNKTSDFGYQTPFDLLTLDPGIPPSALSFSILVRSEVPPVISGTLFRGNKLFAVSAGRLKYIRGSARDEKPNLFNPFWKTELMAVSGEPSARKILPDAVLKGVKH